MLYLLCVATVDPLCLKRICWLERGAAPHKPNGTQTRASHGTPQRSGPTEEPLRMAMRAPTTPRTKSVVTVGLAVTLTADSRLLNHSPGRWGR